MTQRMSRRRFMGVTAATTAGLATGMMTGPFVRRAHAQVKTVLRTKSVRFRARIKAA